MDWHEYPKLRLDILDYYERPEIFKIIKHDSLLQVRQLNIELWDLIARWCGTNSYYKS